MAQVKIRVDEDGHLVLGEVFSGAFIETSEGNRIGFCLRDDTIEFNVLPKESDEKDCRWYRVNMQTREVEKMEVRPEEYFRVTALELTNAIIEDLMDSHHIKFEGRLTHTGRDMVSEKIVEPFLRKLLVEAQSGTVVDEMHVLEECLLDPGYQKLPFPEKESQ